MKFALTTLKPNIDYIQERSGQDLLVNFHNNNARLISIVKNPIKIVFLLFLYLGCSIKISFGSKNAAKRSRQHARKNYREYA